MSERSGGAPSAKFPLIWILVILAGAFLFRVNALWTPHWRGDQAQYVILSMKLANFGLDGYNLRRAAVGNVDLSPSKLRRVEYTAVKPTPDDVPGAYLELMKTIGQAYYDEPLHVRAPLLPYLLALSHRWLSGADQPFMVMSYGLTLADPVLKLAPVWSRQLWAVIVPLGFNLGTVFLTALLAWTVCRRRRPTIYAALLMASNPVSLWLAHRILNEDPATFWITFALLSLGFFRFKTRLVPAAAAGIFLGLSVLTNQRMAMVAAGVAVFAVIALWWDLPGERKLPADWAKRAVRVACHPFFWAFALAFVSVTAFWFIKVISVYGEPFHRPAQGIALANAKDTTGWFAAVSARPHPAVMFALGVPWLSPLLAAAYLTWPRFWGGVRGIYRDDASRGVLLLWSCILLLYFYHANLSYIFGGAGNKEHRYFYPVYPAIAVLAALGLDFLREKAAAAWKRPAAADGILIFLFLMQLAWGSFLAYPKIFGDQLLF